MSKKILQAALVALLSASSASAQLTPTKPTPALLTPSVVTRSQLDVKVFPVGDLVCPPKGSPLAEPGDDDAMKAAAEAYIKARVEALKKEVLTTIDPESWNSTGRSLEYFATGQSLLVVNTPATIARVGECLDSMRKLRDAVVMVEVSLFKVPCEADGVKRVFGNQNSASMTAEELKTMLVELKKSGQIEMITEPKLSIVHNKTGMFQKLQQIPGNDTPLGVSCQMVPVVSSDEKSICLHAKVTNSTPSGSFVQLGNGLKAQAVDSQQTATSVMMKNGGSYGVRLGIQKVEQRVESKIPLLGDLPYVNRLFRNTGIKVERLETIAVFTATQVKPMNASVYPPLPEPTPHLLSKLSYQPMQVSKPHYLNHPPTQLVQATTPTEMPVKEPTLADYHAACAAGQKDEAMELALQLLKKDPMCFSKGK